MISGARENLGGRLVLDRKLRCTNFTCPSFIKMPLTVEEQIEGYIASQTGAKRSDLSSLHTLTLQSSPGVQLWFLDGKNEEGKVVSNPNIGYGLYTIKYADGSTRDFYQVGLSANTAGISVYILGLADKAYLAKTFGEKLGKATITGYCIKFKSLEDVNIDVLLAAIRYGLERKNEA